MQSGWLSRLGAGLFVVPYSLFGLAGALHRCASFDWPLAAHADGALVALATALWLALMLLYGAKCLLHTRVVADEFSHPVQGALLALLPLSTLLAVATLGRAGSLPWLALALLGLAAQGVVAVRVVSLLATGRMPPALVTPALYLPPVAGGFVGGLTLSAIGYPGWGALLFGMGLAGWALLEVRVLGRLFEGPMPLALRATIGVELAPPSIATLAAATIWPQLPGEVLIVGLGVAAGPLVAVMVRYHWWREAPFTPAFWSFCFPLAALAGAVVEVVRRGGWPPFVAAIALACAALVTAYVAVRTLILLWRGSLLPAPAAT
ncbi:MAG: hypothetical protein V4582_25610 [Pseudomonadota bacterium]